MQKISIISAGLFLSLAILISNSQNVRAAMPQITSAKVTSNNTITLVFSESVYAQLGDFYNISGNISGRTLSSVSGSGTNTLTLNFTGTNFAPDATGSLNIASSLVSVLDRMPFASGVVTISDGQAPKVTSLTITSTSASLGNTLASGGDTIAISFNTNKPISTQSVTIDYHLLNFSGSGNGPFSSSYVKTSADSQNSVPVVINLVDAAGNKSTLTSNVSLNLATTISGASTQTNYQSSNQSTASQPVYSSYGFNISLVNGLPTYANSTPSLTFYASSPGTIRMTGDCSTSVVQAVTGNNTITLNALTYGDHNNCTLMLVDVAGNSSNVLSLSAFTVSSSGAGSASGVSAGSATSLSNSASTQNLSFQNSSGFLSMPVDFKYEEAVPTRFIFTKFLKLGIIDDEVAELQKRLTDEGYYTGPITGKFGLLTYNAVVAYQQAHGLDAKGYVGPGTRAALNGQ